MCEVGSCWLHVTLKFNITAHRVKIYGGPEGSTQCNLRKLVLSHTNVTNSESKRKKETQNDKAGRFPEKKKSMGLANAKTNAKLTVHISNNI